MVKLFGKLYDGNTTQPTDGFIWINEEGRVGLGEETLSLCDFHELQIPHRVGHTARALRLPNGALLETRDNDQIDRLVKKFHPEAASIQHRQKSKARLWIAGTVLTILCAVLLFIYGLPKASERIAYQLPHSIPKAMASNTLTHLDQTFFSPSQLPTERQEAIRAYLDELLVSTQVDRSFDYHLHFRTGGESIGANAFALPDGTLLMTDELVALSSNDEELIAILLHEIGHVELRHSLRQTIQVAGAGVIIAWLFGDIGTTSELMLGLPLLLLNADYSREHETEADDFALEQMLALQFDPIYFTHIMEKLSQQSHAIHEELDHKPDNHQESNESSNDTPKEVSTPNGESTTEKILNYFSSHPTSESRMEKFRIASEQLRKEME